MLEFDEYETSAPAWYGAIAKAIKEDNGAEAKSLAESQLAKKRESSSCIAAAKARLSLGDIVGAKSLADEAVTLAKADKVAEGVATHLLARIYLKDKSRKDAHEKADVALKIFEDLNDKSAQASVLLTLAKCKTASDNALDLATQSLTLFKEAANVKGEIAALGFFMEQRLKDGQLEVAKELIIEMSALYEKSADSYGVAGSSLLLSQVESAAGDHQSAVAYAKNAIDTFGKIGDTGKKARALCMLANMLRVATSFQNAHKAATAAFDLSRNSGDKRGQAAALCMTATICDSQNDYSRACYQLEKACRIYRKLNDKKEEAQTLESIANSQMKMFEDLDDVGEPVSICERALALYDEIGLSQSTEAAYLMQTLAFALLAFDKPDASLQRAKESLDIFQLLADRRGEAAAYNVLAQIYFSRDEKDKAKNSIVEATRAAELIGDVGEAEWSKELNKKFSGDDDAENEAKAFQMTDSSGKLIKTVDCYLYRWGVDYVLFEQFVTRGTQEKQGGGKSSSSSAKRLEERVEVESKELDLDLDWAGLATV
jgi:tetratricopeptide (TPR) repeat protein